MTDVYEFMGASSLVPVVVIENPADADALGSALEDGGLPSAEITLRTPGALTVIRELAERPGFVVGAGTVVRPKQVDDAVAAGASYIVSPGFSADVARECAIQRVPLIPGTVTATEIQMALDAGIEVMKFFPAGASGGAPVIKALSAPFPNVRFVPTGGITLDTLPDYLRIPAVLAVGGTWIAPRDIIAAQSFKEITQRVREALAVVEENK
ncbi:MAG: keto-deoxy-phosphogluconate aldolase [Actinobacteria bacterium HGW-Actinobacteria-4]|nr:MAG: keto-deoxy-phosphogluconate aldolase [Actinobacteria bacterium HGW-Actinobacteria-4]